MSKNSEGSLGYQMMKALQGIFNLAPAGIQPSDTTEMRS